MLTCFSFLLPRGQGSTNQPLTALTADSPPILSAPEPPASRRVPNNLQRSTLAPLHTPPSRTDQPRGAKPPLASNLQDRPKTYSRRFAICGQQTTDPRNEIAIHRPPICLRPAPTSEPCCPTTDRAGRDSAGVERFVDGGVPQLYSLWAGGRGRGSKGYLWVCVVFGVFGGAWTCVDMRGHAWTMCGLAGW
jgi:hypothetical protein